ncbi:integral membrane protein [Arthrobacter crystallopoietes BAB-32]|uniref:Integral membrane protein n=1 Tax=Arthrobacter crystallopoietes BAB-32 TaxID=1246476 RepID=N1V9L2_9MICC|nr:integral membrane protein [Arthrobacter crystallopoietes BAB-32]
MVRPAPKAKARRARLLVSKVDPWSVLKMAFLLSVALGIVTVVASIVLWTTLDITGIFDRVNDLLTEIAGTEGGAFDLRAYASLGQVASFATIIAVVNVVLLTALAMLSAVLYNISATLVGGIGVTLTDD